MNNKLNICLISNEFPSRNSIGGIGTYTYNLAKGLHEIGYNVTVITKGNKNLVNTDFKVIKIQKALRLWQFFIIMLQFFNLDQAAEALEFSFRACLKANNLKKRLDIIEGPEWQGQLFFARFFNLPYIIRLHTYTQKILMLEKLKSNFNYSLINFMEKISLRNARSIVAASELIGKDAAKNFNLNPKLIKILALPIDTDLFKGKRTRKKSPVVLFIGRFEIKKGILDLFETIVKVKKVFPTVIYRFVGADQLYSRSETMKQHLVRLGSQKKILNSIEFIENVSYYDLRKYFLNSSVLVNPSKYESFGMTSLEALATNTPLIVSNSSGIAKMISQNNLGTVVRHKKDLAMSIVQTLKNTKPKDTRKFVLRNLSSKKIAAKMANIYLSVKK